MMKSSKAKLFACLLLGAVAGCSQVRPFVDSRREAGQVNPVGQSRPDYIAVCYNPLWSDSAEAAQLAASACATRSKQAVFDKASPFNCRLLTPTTAFYRCVSSP